MTNTRIHPVKRVITFIMALLMTLSAIVYYDFSSNAAAYSVSTGSNVWKGWFDAYIAATGAYWNGLGSYNTNYNPFSVNSSGHLVADIKERSNSVNNVNSLIDKATVVSSTKSICPSGYSMTININTSRNATYNAVDKNGWGSFSVGFLTGDPALDCMTNWAFAVQNGFGNSSNGLVLTFGSFVASTNTYDKMIIWLNGTPQHIITLKDIGMTVYCNGTSDTTFALERISSGVYDIVLSVKI